MADSIVFRYEQMHTAADNIRNIATDYQNSATKFQGEFADAIKDWEGASKIAVEKFINGAVMEYIGDTIPKLLNSLAELLEANITQMTSADDQIAENIPTTLGA